MRSIAVLGLLSSMAFAGKPLLLEVDGFEAAFNRAARDKLVVIVSPT